MPQTHRTSASPMDTYVTTISPVDMNNNLMSGNSLRVPGHSMQTTQPAPQLMTTIATPSPPPLSRPTSADPWADLIKPQIFVIKNPMHIINFNQNQSRSKLVRFFQLLKSFTEKWFSHLLLLGVLFLYGCFGAWMFILMEGGVRQEIHVRIIQFE
jgi:hypothetical protein